MKSRARTPDNADAIMVVPPKRVSIPKSVDPPEPSDMDPSVDK